MTDPIADMLIRIKNGYMSGKKTVALPHSSIKLSLARLLAKHGYVDTVSVADVTPQKKAITVQLKYANGIPAVEQIVRFSKPGLRRYHGYRTMPRTRIGLTVVSTI